MLLPGRLLRVTLWGESHGPAVGVTIEGLPPGLPVDLEEVRRLLARRRPGGKLVSPRMEPDEPEILSGVYEGYTTGAPVTVVIRNRDVDSTYYLEEVQYKPRPGHGDLTRMIASSGFYDVRGGGEASGRHTAGLVAAYALAKPILDARGVRLAAYLKRLGSIECRVPVDADADRLVEAAWSNPVPCPDPSAADEMARAIEEARAAGRSLGGVVEVRVYGAPPGLGSPLEPIDAAVAAAVMSVPGVRAFEVGEGVELSKSSAPEALDAMRLVSSPHGVRVGLEPNRSGGVLAGITTGDVMVFRAYFKPTSTVPSDMRTVDLRSLSEATTRGRGRHDPAIAVRGVAAVEAAVALVVADYILVDAARRNWWRH